MKGGKTKAARRKVVLGVELVRALREQLLARQGTRLLFPKSTGKRWDAYDFMEDVFRPARDGAGLDGVTFHDLRQTTISLMAKAARRRSSSPRRGRAVRGSKMRVR